LEKTRQKYESLSQTWEEALQEKEKHFSNDQGQPLRVGSISGSARSLNGKKNGIKNIGLFRSNQPNPQKVNINKKNKKKKEKNYDDDNYIMIL